MLESRSPAPLIALMALLVLCAGSPCLAEARAPEIDEAIRLLEHWIEEQRVHRDLPGISVGVVHGEELVWSRGFGFSDRASKTPATPTTLYRIGSVTKLFTSTAILHLRDAGKLSLDDPVVRHLPEFAIKTPFEDQPPITIRHLLTHTSGLPREAAFPYWTTHEFPRRDEVMAALPRQEAIYPPATKYKYSNLGMALLGEVVAAASGGSYRDYIHREIFGPLGMGASVVTPGEDELSRMATAYMRRQPDGSRKTFEYYDTGAIAPAANIVSTVQDLARFASLHLRQGQEVAGAQILAASTLREMQRPQWMKESWTSARGLGFSISRREGKTLVSHGGWVGGNRTLFLLAPVEKIAVVVMINADDGSPGFFGHRISDTLGPVLLAAAKSPERPAVDRGAWADYVGTYADPWDWQYEVMIRGGNLFLYEHSYPPEDAPEDSLSALQPISADTFRLSDGELLVFETDEAGKVWRIRRRYEYLYPSAPTP